MNFIKKIFIFLLVMVVVIAQFDVAVLAASEYPTYSIIEHYFNNQDSNGQPRILWIGYDNYDRYYNRFKLYNPYGGDYLTLNGSKYDDFGGQVDINNPASISCLGVNCWDHVIITIGLGEEFLDNKCLDALFSLLKESGDITVPIFWSQLTSLKYKLRSNRELIKKSEEYSDSVKKEKLEQIAANVSKIEGLENLFSIYDWGGTAFMHGQLDIINVIEAIKIIYQCDSGFVIKNCRTAVDCKRERGCFFLGNLGEYEGLRLIEPRYIVTLQKQTV